MSDTPSFQTGHVGLNVTNLQRSKKFYQDVFNFHTIGESNENGRNFAFLGTEDTLVLTLWEQSEGDFATNHPGLHHLSFQVDSMAIVQDIQSHLREMGVNLIYDDVVPHSEGASSGAIFFTDPDGIRLEIFSPQGAEKLEVQSDGPACGFF